MLKDQILSADDRPKPEPYPVPEWNCTVYLRVMEGAERDDYESEMFAVDGENVELNRENARARLLVRCLCDENGNRIFADGEAGKLGKKNSVVLDRLFERARKINRLSKKDIEELTKNSSTGPVNTSNSASPVTSA